MLLVILMRDFSGKCKYKAVCIFNVPLLSNMLLRHVHYVCIY